METICQVCNSVRDDCKLGIHFQKLLPKLRIAFRKYGFNISIKSCRTPKLDSEEFYVNAYYDPVDDHLDDVAIEVIVFHNFDLAIRWDKKQITDLLIEIFDALVHEFKHQRQSQKRQYESFWNNSTIPKQYLSDPDELDAYSISIAIELCRSLGKFRALRYMPKFSRLSRMRIRGRYASSNLYAYLETLGNLEQPIIKKLAKKIYIRLQKIDTDCIFM